MVERQLRRRGITDQRVLAAMGSVSREQFVNRRERRWAYSDGALSIGHGQTISQPWVVASICQALAPAQDDDALEIGTGSGYSTAILAALCRSVLSFEIVEPLCEVAKDRLTELGNVEVRCGDGAADPPDRSFDVVAVHAATPGPPAELLARLADGGRLVAPVRRGRYETLTLFSRTGETVSETEIAEVRFVPLTGRVGQ